MHFEGYMYTKCNREPIQFWFACNQNKVIVRIPSMKLEMLFQNYAHVDLVNYFKVARKVPLNVIS